MSQLEIIWSKGFSSNGHQGSINIDRIYDLFNQRFGSACQVIHPHYICSEKRVCKHCRRKMRTIRIVFVFRRNAPRMVTYYCETCGTFTKPIENFIDCSTK